MLMRTDPFRELDRFVQQVVGTPTRPAAMPIDAYRDADQFVVEFDLPGVAADSIDLTVEKNVLTVHATRPRADRDGRELIVAERPTGTFSRQLFLGDTLDAERVEAHYDDGVLRVTIPVAERAKPRKVSIHAESRAGRHRFVTLPIDDPHAPWFSIGQVAAMLAVQQAFLRRIDAEALVCPSRSAGGQRRYTRHEIDQVQRVVRLVDEGLTLEGIRRLMILEDQVADLQRQLEVERARRPR